MQQTANINAIQTNIETEYTQSSNYTKFCWQKVLSILYRKISDCLFEMKIVSAELKKNAIEIFCVMCTIAKTHIHTDSTKREYEGIWLKTVCINVCRCCI